MPAPLRVTNEEIVSAYKETGSVWKAGRKLGIVGQSVWERLVALGYPISGRKWDTGEIDELRSLLGNCTLSEISRRLARPYYSVALKVSRLGLGGQYSNSAAKKIPRGSGLDQKKVLSLISDLRNFEGGLRQFVRTKGLDIELFVLAVQKYDMDFWREYTKTRSDIGETKCAYCTNVFYPMNARQKTCSRKCSKDMRVDEQYFGGNRRNTIGLTEGICQLCLQPKSKGLSSHHMIGKENDPDNTLLIALCMGCHQLVGRLAGRKFVDCAEGWENLITLVMCRRMAEKSSDYTAAYACVDMEYVTHEELEDSQVSAWGRNIHDNSLAGKFSK